MKAATRPRQQWGRQWGVRLAWGAYPNEEQTAERTAFCLGYGGVRLDVGPDLLRSAEERMEAMSLGAPFRAGVAAALQLSS